MTEKTLVDSEKYLKSGAHIGTRYKSGDMRKYIFKIRKDNLNVMDIQTLDERIRASAKFLAQFSPGRIAVVSRRLYGRTPAMTFAQSIGAKEFTGRFVPGTFTNYTNSKFFEPQVVFVVEPEQDGQAIEEARKINVPVVAVVSTNNSIRNVDMAIPANNKGRKSLALVFWLLAREFLKEKKLIEDDSGFTKTVEDFEYKMKENEKEEEPQEMRRPIRDRDRDRRGPPRERR